MICNCKGDVLELTLNKSEQKKVKDADAILRSARRLLGIPDLTLDKFASSIGDDGKARATFAKKP